MSNYVFPVLDDYRITSIFGPRSSPGGIGSTNHQGLDISTGQIGSQVVAPIAGQVIFAGKNGGYGNQVQLLGNDGLIHSFSHLSGFNTTKGSLLSAGENIGLIGSTGTATGPHLHYAVKDPTTGKFINPQSILSKAVEAVTGGKNLVDTAISAITGVIPGGGLVAGALDAVGIGGKSWIDQIRDWLAESHFWQRVAMGSLAIALIMGALYLLGRTKVIDTVKEIV